MRIDIPEEKRLVHEMRMPIRWGDMDAFGHVNNTVFFRYMEQARVEWIESLGFGIQIDKTAMLMVNGFCNFYQQLNYPGELVLKTYIGAIGKSSVDMYTTMALVTNETQLVAAGGATMVCVDLQTNKSIPWSNDVLQKIA
jgi:acyl-CoA thioester hydrolase